MKTLLFLPASKKDLRWFHQYYTRVFPEGKRNADVQFRALRKNLRENPEIGHTSEIVEGALEFILTRTPFTVLYRVTETEVQVLRVYDQRNEFSNIGK